MPRLAQIARSARIEGGRRGAGVARLARLAGPRLALLARVGIAVALIPLLLAGLAVAGVTVPDPAPARRSRRSVWSYPTSPMSRRVAATRAPSVRTRPPGRSTRRPARRTGRRRARARPTIPRSRDGGFAATAMARSRSCQPARGQGPRPVERPRGERHLGSSGSSAGKAGTGAGRGRGPGWPCSVLEQRVAVGRRACRRASRSRSSARRRSTRSARTASRPAAAARLQNVSAMKRSWPEGSTPWSSNMWLTRESSATWA